MKQVERTVSAESRTSSFKLVVDMDTFHKHSFKLIREPKSLPAPRTPRQ